MNSNSLEDFTAIRNRRSDVTFVFYNKEKNEKRILNAHKLCLANASDVFDTMFFGSLPEKQEIMIEDFSVEIFEIMLNYIYSHAGDSIKVDSLDVAMELLKLAKKYMLQKLENFCEQCMKELLTTPTALKALTFATYFKLKSLQAAALKIISSETREILQMPTFKDIDGAVLLEIVKQDVLDASEFQLFKAVELVAKHQGITKGSILDSSYNSAELQASPAWQEFRQIIKQIRFLAFTSEQFLEGPALSSLLTLDEAFFINICLAHPNKVPTHYPKEFIQSERKFSSVRRVFFDISAHYNKLGRLVMELRGDIVPKSARSFFDRCVGRNNVGFKGVRCEHISTEGFSFTSVNLKTRKGEEGYKTVVSENFTLKHENIGTLAMHYENRFRITFKPLPEQDNKAVVIGKVVDGLDVLKIISSYKFNEVVIENCGELN